jgi:hypothetical protein
MSPVAYSGSLQPKKKAELQEISLALRLSDQGTKEELQGRIKKHLDSNQATLEEHPTFMGLFGRRKRQGSVPPGSVFSCLDSPNVDVSSHFQTICPGPFARGNREGI